MGLMPGGRVLGSVCWRVVDVWEDVVVEGGFVGRVLGRLNIEGEESGIAVTVAEDTVAVESVAVSRVFVEV